jgi:hypothetical protein
VIFAGDFNAQYDTIPVSRIAQAKPGPIKQLICPNSLVPINKTEIPTGKKYTFAPLKTTMNMYLCLHRSLITFYCATFSALNIQVLYLMYCKFNVSVGQYKADSTARPLCLLGWNKATSRCWS